MKNSAVFVSLFISLMLNACDTRDFSNAGAASQGYSIRVDNTPTATTSEDAIKTPTATTSEDAIKTPTATTSEDAINAEVTKAPQTDPDAEACAKLTGVSATKIKVSGSSKDIKISSQQPVALKITGNKNQYAIDLNAQDATTQVKAVCLFIAGNQNVVNISLGLHLNAIHVIARGNQPQINITTAKGSIIDVINMEAKGNNGNMTITGEGAFPCDGTNASITCEKKVAAKPAP